jgi:hypothetical protein
VILWTNLASGGTSPILMKLPWANDIDTWMDKSNNFLMQRLTTFSGLEANGVGCVIYIGYISFQNIEIFGLEENNPLFGFFGSSCHLMMN